MNCSNATIRQLDIHASNTLNIKVAIRRYCYFTKLYFACTRILVVKDKSVFSPLFERKDNGGIDVGNIDLAVMIHIGTGCK